ncbi:hypothetical protein [Candidatus Nanohalococcus occultus]|uniref:AMIN domain-containing protein n=1 Tax=Candidatus Nanohalococcus occultus TaxID=2978047 RepID=A0ABY8CJH2_9ARCH|nr:hypothetical protein SVXNc_0460 [Candidatus Nanohaloarchaeota archaeon SVXNc]
MSLALIPVCSAVSIEPANISLELRSGSDYRIPLKVESAATGSENVTLGLKVDAAETDTEGIDIRLSEKQIRDLRGKDRIYLLINTSFGLKPDRFNISVLTDSRVSESSVQEANVQSEGSGSSSGSETTGGRTGGGLPGLLAESFGGSTGADWDSRERSENRTETDNDTTGIEISNSSKLRKGGGGSSPSDRRVGAFAEYVDGDIIVLLAGLAALVTILFSKNTFSRIYSVLS